MEKEEQKSTSLRGTRGSRGNRLLAAASRDRPEEKSPLPKSSQPPKESSNPEPAQPSRGRGQTRGPRGRRGQNRQLRNRRLRPPNRTAKRLERAENAMRNQPRGQRRRFRARRGFFGMRRRPFGRRSLFIAGLPKNVNRFRLSELLREEGKLIRCTLLKDRFGRSRGIAFAEMQNPRVAGNIIQKWRGRIVDGNTIFVTFKRNPNRWNYYSRYNNRFGFGNNRQYNNFGNYNARYQRTYRPRGNRGRGRGRGRGF